MCFSFLFYIIKFFQCLYCSKTAKGMEYPLVSSLLQYFRIRHKLRQYNWTQTTSTYSLNLGSWRYFSGMLGPWGACTQWCLTCCTNTGTNPQRMVVACKVSVQYNFLLKEIWTTFSHNSFSNACLLIIHVCGIHLQSNMLYSAAYCKHWISGKSQKWTCYICTLLNGFCFTEVMLTTTDNLHKAVF